MNKLFVVVAVCVALYAAATQGIVTTGKCTGSNSETEWSFDSKTLVLTLEGRHYSTTRDCGFSEEMKKSVHTVDVKADVEEISPSTFKSFQNLTTVTLASSVYRISSNAFEDCTKLKSINLNRVAWIYSAAFRRCSSLTSVNFPNVIEISDEAFSGCTSLKSLVLSSSVSRINQKAFLGCSKLETIDFSTVSEINEEAFKGCSSLKSVDIPNSVTYIGKGAFAGCSSLESAVVSESLRTGFFVGPGSIFQDCPKLVSLSFPGCLWGDGGRLHSVKKLTVTGSCAGDDLFSGWEKLETVVLTDSVKKIEREAFQSCRNLKSVTISSATEIGESAFRYCESLTSITLGDSLEHIGPNAFDSCEDLTSIEIPKSVNAIDNNAFHGCCKLRTITYKGKQDPGRFSKYVFSECGGLERTVEVPSDYSGRYFCSLLVKGALSDGAIIGISVGSAAVIIALIIIIIVVVHKKRKGSSEKVQQTEMS